MTFQISETWRAVGDERRSRLAVMAIASILVIAGFEVPLPIIDSIGSEHRHVSHPFSLFYRGFQAWGFMVACAELFRLAFPGLISLDLTRRGHINPFNSWVIAAALILVAFQAYELTLRIGEHYVIATGRSEFLDRMTIILTRVAGVSTMLLLARWVDVRCPGQGFWWLLALLYVWDWPQDILEYWRDHPFLPNYEKLVFWNAAGLLVSTAIIMGVLLLRRRNGDRATASLLWPWFLSTHVTGWLWSAIDYILPPDSRAVFKFYESHWYEVLFFLVILTLTFFYTRNERSVPIRWVTLSGFAAFVLIYDAFQWNNNAFLLLLGMPTLLMGMAALYMQDAFTDRAGWTSLKKILQPRGG
jgi:preprotein translocase subunit SecG